jgi:hypothetical protein
MNHLSTSIHVDASPEIVFDIVADPSRSPEWQTLVAEIGEVSGRAGGVGSSYVGYYRVAGRRVQGRFVVTAAERPSLYQAAGTTRGGWARWTTLIREAGAGSDVRVSIEYELPGEIPASLFGIVTTRRLQREFETTYNNLKRVAEAETEAQAEAARSVEARFGGVGAAAAD